ncbi:MAG: hypothetical protein LBS84_12005, partial [Clostridiales bacterium]|nr:hypothetical protein [Clostridiales bacterium]
MRDRNLWKSFVKIVTNRCLIVFVLILAAFYVLMARLFFLQLVIGQTFLNKQIITQTEKITLPASRGNIYDRLGRPLAINKAAYSLKMDASVVEIDAEKLHDLIKLLESKGETIVDRFPFTKQEPYEFAFEGTGRSEERWKLDMDFEGADLNLNAS